VGVVAVLALISIKNGVNDPHNIMENWDINYVDPCSWSTITFSANNLVIAL